MPSTSPGRDESEGPVPSGQSSHSLAWGGRDPSAPTPAEGPGFLSSLPSPQPQQSRNSTEVLPLDTAARAPPPASRMGKTDRSSCTGSCCCWRSQEGGYLSRDSRVYYLKATCIRLSRPLGTGDKQEGGGCRSSHPEMVRALAPIQRALTSGTTAICHR